MIRSATRLEEASHGFFSPAAGGLLTGKWGAGRRPEPAAAPGAAATWAGVPREPVPRAPHLGEHAPAGGAEGLCRGAAEAAVGAEDQYGGAGLGGGVEAGHGGSVGGSDASVGSRKPSDNG